MKGQILKSLRAKAGVISGEALSSMLGVSRVSVWKHIKKLQEVGYDIVSTPKGYKLIGSPDTPFPWEFPDRESKISYFPEVGSTMDIARDLARKGCPHFTVVVAGSQKNGRGRLKRVWISSEGGLYFTIVVRPKIPPALSSRVNFSASLVLAKTFRRMFGINAMVKWPNDILVDEMKVVGMLSEMDAESDIVSFINIGMGINVNNDLTPEIPFASSLKTILGKEVSRKELLSEFLDRFEEQINNEGFDNVISEWKKYTTTLNRYVRITANNDVSEGVAIDVDENGALILELGDGSLKKVIYGDCFHQGRI